MDHNETLSEEVRWVEPFKGLMIDDATWRDAHHYHRQHQWFHALLLHGGGIVRGLEVDPNPRPDRSVWIGAGAAVDPKGQLIVVREAYRYALKTETEGIVYLLLTFRGVGERDTALSMDDGQQRFTRWRDSFQITESDHLPDGAYIELARIRLSKGKRSLVTAAVSAAPGLDQIDLRFRVEAALRPGPPASLGCWRSGPAAPGSAEADHAVGLESLMRELAGPRWQLEWTDQPAGIAEPIDCDLLVLPLGTGELAAGDVRRLTAFLDEGGVVLAEPCVAHLSEAERAAALDGLARVLERPGAPVELGHPLLAAAHIFAAPPPGIAVGSVLEADGLILSQADYACAWKGSAPGRLLSREAIRTVHEWGANLLAYALERRRARKVGR